MKVIQSREALKNPYRIWFAAGWLMGLIGASLWLLLILGGISFYPKEMHADIMVGGFVLFYAAGFLMTALPRFTNSFGVLKHEVVLFSVASLLLFGTSFLQNRIYFHAALFSALLLLIRFFIWRFLYRSSMPPPPLVFVIAGLVAGLMGVSLMIFGDFFGSDLSLTTFGQSLFYQGLQIFLILGIGLFLIPNLLGRPSCSPPSPIQVGPKSFSFLKTVPAPFWAIIAMMFISFIVELAAPVVGRTIRAAILTLIGIVDWKIHKYPKMRTVISFGVWVACWSLVIGHWLSVINPEMAIHMRHLMYIGGFGLITLMVGTRVTLAHGGHDMGIEKKSKLLMMSVGFIILAALTRVIAKFLPEAVYWHHLAYASASWIVSLFFWGILCLPKLSKDSR